MIVALTGSLERVSRELAERWGVVKAIVLDNGGSGGWRYSRAGESPPVLLVAGANHRPAGMVFLHFDIGEFPQPVSHGCRWGERTERPERSGTREHPPPAQG